jgi:hypothetical protein
MNFPINMAHNIKQMSNILVGCTHTHTHTHSIFRNALHCFWVFGLAFVGKDIVFRFTLEYSSLRAFGTYVVRSIFIWVFLKDNILACVETWD